MEVDLVVPIESCRESNNVRQYSAGFLSYQRLLVYS